MIKDQNNPDLQEKQELHGFKIKRIVHLEKLKNILYELEHVKTGAKLIHLSNDDDNNCFGVAFRTTPEDSTGVAHILEHTALCGSEKYPVRDPFFSMIRRSMKTFMNAFTASDWTMYPFSTQNETDFYNLMGIYLDAAFFPQLTELNFLQEGHRLEFSEENNPESKLEIKGIVYNEMKGAMSSQGSLMYRRMGQALYPTITYRHNSGGEPENIPELTWQGLKDFHARHYHPSNSWFYTYGDLPLEQHLSVIEEKVLSRFEKISPNTEVPVETRYTEPRESEFVYPLGKEDDDGKKCQVSLAWLTTSIRDPFEVLSLQLINLILLGNAAAPLRKALLESNLGKALADSTGYEDDLSETYFSVGLQGTSEDKVEEIEKLILDTLQQVVSNGIDNQQIESAIHQMEMDVREISGGHYPYALNLLFRFFGPWMHGGDPVEAIDFDKNMEQLRSRISEGPFLENQIQKHFLNNPHRVRVLLKPDHELEKRQQEKVEKELAEKKKQLTDAEKESILKVAAQLKKQQEEEEDLSCLPTLQVSDIPVEKPGVDPYQITSDPVDLTLYDQPTNGLVYYSWYFNMPEISDEDRVWLPLLAYLLPKCGAGEWNYEELAVQKTMYTGGFSASASVSPVVFDAHSYMDVFSFGSKALARNQEKLIEIGGKIITEWDFSDLARVKSLIAQRSNSLQNSVVESGHGYAASLAKRKFGRTNQIDEVYGGVHQVQFMKSLAEKAEEELAEVVERLNLLGQKILQKKNLKVLVIGDKEELEGVEKRVAGFVNQLPEKDAPEDLKHAVEGDVQFPKESWTTTTPVSYVARSYKTASYTDKDAAKLQVLAALMQANFLHREIREKGGAYGGMASYSNEEGIFSMLSYRDPHLARTIDVFDQAVEWVLKGEFSDQDVSEAILQTASRMDTPSSPAGKAAQDYSFRRKGKTLELRNQFRAGVLSTTKAELVEVAKKWLQAESSTVAVTSEDSLTRDESSLASRQLEQHKI